MSCVRLTLVVTLASLWIIGFCAGAATDDSKQLTPARRPGTVVPKGAPKLNASKVGAVESEAEKNRRLRLQRKKEKKERRRQKKLLRQRRRRERKLRRQQNQALKKDEKTEDGKNKNGQKKKQKKQKKKKKKGKKRKNKRKNRKNKNKRNRRKNKKSKGRKKKKKNKNRKNGKKNNRKRKKKKAGKRSAVLCKTDSDCAKVGPNHCCQHMTGRCVRPKGGLKCFGSCMCKARKHTENFLCVTKKKKFEKFLSEKKLGKIVSEKPRGHCSNVTITELKDPKGKFQQIV